MTISSLTRAVAALGGLFSLAVVGYAGDWSSIALIILGPIFALWAALPFAILYGQARALAAKPTQSIWAELLLLLSAMAITALSIAVYWRPFIAKVNTDAQDGIILLILPLYMLVFVGLAVAIAHFITRK